MECQFIEKFQEVKEKTKVNQATAQKPDGGQPGSGGSPSSTLSRAQANVQSHPGHTAVALTAALDSSAQAEVDSPKHKVAQAAQAANQLPQSTVEAQLRYENDRLKLALAQRYTIKLEYLFMVFVR